MKTLLISLIMQMSPYFDIPPELAVAIATQESSLNPKAVGSVGEVGLFQIRPKYSKFSRNELFNPVINTLEGMRFLQHAKKNCKHQLDSSWIICYNLGVRGASKIKKPKKFDYYIKVMERLK